MTRRAAAKLAPHDRDLEHERASDPERGGVAFSATLGATSPYPYRHGLGRVYRGLNIHCQSESVAVYVATPEVCSAAGYDPAVFIYLSHTGAVACVLRGKVF